MALLKSIFNEMEDFDMNHDGIISEDERNMYLSKDKDFIKYIKYDKDHNGIISPDEYLEIMIDELSDLEKEELDTNHDGILDIFESFPLTQTYQYQEYYEKYNEYARNHIIEQNKDFQEIEEEYLERIKNS